MSQVVSSGDSVRVFDGAVIGPYYKTFLPLPTSISTTSPHLLVPVDGGKERRQPVTVHLTVCVEEEYHVSPRFLGPGCASADQASSLLVPDEAYKSIPAGDVVL